jgi:hypothetical protein
MAGAGDGTAGDATGYTVYVGVCADTRKARQAAAKAARAAHRLGITRGCPRVLTFYAKERKNEKKIKKMISKKPKTPQQGTHFGSFAHNLLENTLECDPRFPAPPTLYVEARELPGNAIGSAYVISR